MREFLNALRVLIAVDVGIVVFCYLEDNTLWLYNTQVAFFSVSFSHSSSHSFKNIIFLNFCKNSKCT